MMRTDSTSCDHKSIVRSLGAGAFGCVLEVTNSGPHPGRLPENTHNTVYKSFHSTSVLQTRMPLTQLHRNLLDECSDDDDDDEDDDGDEGEQKHEGDDADEDEDNGKMETDKDKRPSRRDPRRLNGRARRTLYKCANLGFLEDMERELHGLAPVAHDDLQSVIPIFETTRPADARGAFLHHWDPLCHAGEYATDASADKWIQDMIATRRVLGCHATQRSVLVDAAHQMNTILGQQSFELGANTPQLASELFVNRRDAIRELGSYDLLRRTLGPQVASYDVDAFCYRVAPDPAHVRRAAAQTSLECYHCDLDPYTWALRGLELQKGENSLYKDMEWCRENYAQVPRPALPHTPQTQAVSSKQETDKSSRMQQNKWIRDYGSHDSLIRIMAQLVQSIGTMHLHGLAHRDIKPLNVIVLRGQESPGEADTVQVASSDFGGSRRVWLPAILPPLNDVYSALSGDASAVGASSQQSQRVRDESDMNADDDNDDVRDAEVRAKSKSSSSDARRIHHLVHRDLTYCACFTRGFRPIEYTMRQANTRNDHLADAWGLGSLLGGMAASQWCFFGDCAEWQSLLEVMHTCRAGWTGGLDDPVLSQQSVRDNRDQDDDHGVGAAPEVPHWRALQNLMARGLNVTDDLATLECCILFSPLVWCQTCLAERARTMHIKQSALKFQPEWNVMYADHCTPSECRKASVDGRLLYAAHTPQQAPLDHNLETIPVVAFDPSLTLAPLTTGDPGVFRYRMLNLGNQRWQHIPPHQREALLARFKLRCHGCQPLAEPTRHWEFFLWRRALSDCTVSHVVRLLQQWSPAFAFAATHPSQDNAMDVVGSATSASTKAASLSKKQVVRLRLVVVDGGMRDTAKWCGSSVPLCRETVQGNWRLLSGHDFVRNSSRDRDTLEHLCRLGQLALSSEQQQQQPSTRSIFTRAEAPAKSSSVSVPRAAPGFVVRPTKKTSSSSSSTAGSSNSANARSRRVDALVSSIPDLTIEAPPIATGQLLTHAIVLANGVQIEISYAPSDFGQQYDWQMDWDGVLRALGPVTPLVSFDCRILASALSANERARPGVSKCDLRGNQCSAVGAPCREFGGRSVVAVSEQADAERVARAVRACLGIASTMKPSHSSFTPLVSDILSNAYHAPWFHTWWHSAMRSISGMPVGPMRNAYEHMLQLSKLTRPSLRTELEQRILPTQHELFAAALVNDERALSHNGHDNAAVNIGFYARHRKSPQRGAEDTLVLDDLKLKLAARCGDAPLTAHGTTAAEYDHVMGLISEMSFSALAYQAACATMSFDPQHEHVYLANARLVAARMGLSDSWSDFWSAISQPQDIGYAQVMDRALWTATDALDAPVTPHPLLSLSRLANQVKGSFLDVVQTLNNAVDHWHKGQTCLDRGRLPWLQPETTDATCALFEQALRTRPLYATSPQSAAEDAVVSMNPNVKCRIIDVLFPQLENLLPSELNDDREVDPAQEVDANQERLKLIHYYQNGVQTFLQGVGANLALTEELVHLMVSCAHLCGLLTDTSHGHDTARMTSALLNFCHQQWVCTMAARAQTHFQWMQHWATESPAILEFASPMFATMVAAPSMADYLRDQGLAWALRGDASEASVDFQKMMNASWCGQWGPGLCFAPTTMHLIVCLDGVSQNLTALPEGMIYDGPDCKSICRRSPPLLGHVLRNASAWEQLCDAVLADFADCLTSVAPDESTLAEMFASPAWCALDPAARIVLQTWLISGNRCGEGGDDSTRRAATVDKYAVGEVVVTLHPDLARAEDPPPRSQPHATLPTPLCDLREFAAAYDHRPTLEALYTAGTRATYESQLQDRLFSLLTPSALLRACADHRALQPGENGVSAIASATSLTVNGGDTHAGALSAATKHKQRRRAHGNFWQVARLGIGSATPDTAQHALPVGTLMSHVMWSDPLHAVASLQAVHMNAHANPMHALNLSRWEAIVQGLATTCAKNKQEADSQLLASRKYELRTLEYLRTLQARKRLGYLVDTDSETGETYLWTNSSDLLHTRMQGEILCSGQSHLPHASLTAWTYESSVRAELERLDQSGACFFYGERTGERPGVGLVPPVKGGGRSGAAKNYRGYLDASRLFDRLLCVAMAGAPDFALHSERHIVLGLLWCIHLALHPNDPMQLLRPPKDATTPAPKRSTAPIHVFPEWFDGTVVLLSPSAMLQASREHTEHKDASRAVKLSELTGNRVMRHACEKMVVSWHADGVVPGVGENCDAFLMRVLNPMAGPHHRPQSRQNMDALLRAHYVRQTGPNAGDAEHVHFWMRRFAYMLVLDLKRSTALRSVLFVDIESIFV